MNKNYTLLSSIKPIGIQKLFFPCLFFFSSFGIGTHFHKAKETTSEAKSEFVQVSDLCYSKNTSFQDGEQITYSIYYNWNFVWMAAGEVTFEVQDVGDQYYIKAKGRTYPSYEWFYKVRDDFEAYLDKNSLLPTVAVRSVEEGKYKLYDKTIFDQSKRKAVTYRGNAANNTKKEEFNVRDCIYDVLSAVYYARNIDFDAHKSGTSFPLRIFLDKEIYDLKFKYMGKVNNLGVRGLGKFNAIKFVPDLVEDRVFKNGAKMNIWASNDENRIPLLVESPVSVGSVKVVLKSYKNLRYNLSSKIE